MLAHTEGESMVNCDVRGERRETWFPSITGHHPSYVHDKRDAEKIAFCEQAWSGWKVGAACKQLEGDGRRSCMRSRLSRFVKAFMWPSAPMFLARA